MVRRDEKKRKKKRLFGKWRLHPREKCGGRMRIAQGVHGVLVHGGVYSDRMDVRQWGHQNFLELVYLGVYGTRWGNPLQKLGYGFILDVKVTL